jgi:hypothetical protein
LEKQEKEMCTMTCSLKLTALDNVHITTLWDVLQSRHVLARLRPDMYFNMPKCQNVGDSEVGDPKLTTRKDTKIGSNRIRSDFASIPKRIDPQSKLSYSMRKNID